MKKVLIGCGIVAAVFIIGVPVLLFIFGRVIMPKVVSGMKMAPQLQNPTVLTGNGFLNKAVFIADSTLGSVSSIVVGDLDRTTGQEIGVAGSDGALLLNADKSLISQVSYSSGDNLDIIDIENDGECEYLSRGSWSSDAFLLDHKGMKIWTYGGSPGVDDTSPGDINQDGKAEFAVGFNGGGGVHLLSTQGKKTWQRSDGNVWHVEMIDTNSDGRLEILHSNAAGQIVVRDASGNILRSSKPTPYFSHFSICKWPDKTSRSYAFITYNDLCWILDYDGTTVAQLNAPYCGTLGSAKATPVKLVKNQPEYFAVLVDFKQWNRSILYLYGHNKNLVYEEVLDGPNCSIAALPDKNGSDRLLIGGKNTVWEYTMPQIVHAN
jgi:hypothetical protein